MFRPFKLPFVVYILTTVGAAFRDVKFTEWSLGSLKFGQILEFFSTGGLQISRVVSRDFDVNKPLLILLVYYFFLCLKSLKFEYWILVWTVRQWKIKMQTIQYKTSRIWEMKEDKCTKRLAENQVCAIFQMRDVRKNDLPKFIKLCMETPCWSCFQGHQYGCRIPTETSVFEFSY